MSVVVLTGGSGVVGGAVLRHLLAAGHEVRALSRSEGFSVRLREMGVQPVPGELFDAAMSRACQGAELVFHVAGVNELCAKNPDEMERVNVDGTRLVLHSAQLAGVRRVVVTSSAATLGEERGEVGDESTRHRGWFLSHYERTKTMGELVARQWPGDLEVVTVNPSSVQGPGRATGTGKLLLRAVQGKLPVLPNVPISIVDIDDCAAGHLLAAEQGEPGERYVLNGFSVAAGEALLLLSAVAGTRLSTRLVSAGVLRAAAGVSGALERVVRLPGPVCAESLKTMSFGHRYDGSRATRDLGLEYRKPEETLRRFTDWAAQHHP